MRRTVERLVRIFFHAGLCQFEMVRGVCAGCWWGDRSRLELFVIATPRCRADRIISRRPRYAREPFGVGVLLFCCVLTGLLFYYSNVSVLGTRHLWRVPSNALLEPFHLYRIARPIRPMTGKSQIKTSVAQNILRNRGYFPLAWAISEAMEASAKIAHPILGPSPRHRPLCAR